MKTTARILGSLLLSGILFGSALPAFAETSTGEIILDAGTTPGGGDIELISVTDFDFGTHTISGTKETYQLSTNTTKTTISDLRGTGAGWTLDAKISEFKTADSTPKTLRGAAFNLPQGVLTSDNPAALPPTANALTLNTELQTIITAGTDTGMGQWEQDYAQASLVVPSGNHAGKYQADLEWILTATPLPNP